ncbi:helix-turn-helix domain-containing protein [Faecalibacter bovis]|uniref:Helix-turn-helix domain-containing protein n=1 Tax=Faecalibacter bovis TaxID=2898187 RepID=A0ABX7XBK1_9FLAO|nr:helix-turn-helix domain-containing protein [Faecalibacter bovis]QTV05281.1 helix-turn-helix domain-containing protein [Faecalibacter bovis]
MFLVLRLLFILTPAILLSQQKSSYEEIYNNIENHPTNKQIIIADSLLKNAKNANERVYSYFYKAHIGLYSNDYHQAYENLNMADSIIEANHFTKEKVTALFMLNGVYQNLKMYAKYKDNIQEINDIIEQWPKDEHYLKVKAGNLLSLANYYSYIKDHENALIEYKRSIEFLEDKKMYTKTLLKAYNDLAILYGKDDLDSSIKTFSKMNDINTKYVNNKLFSINYYLNVGVCYKLKEDYNKSKEFLEKALALANKYEIEFYISSINDQLVIIYDKLGNETKSDSIANIEFAKTKEVLKNKLETNNIVTNKIINQAKQEIDNQSESKSYLIFIAGFIVCFLAAIIFILFRKKREEKRKFDQILASYNKNVASKVDMIQPIEKQQSKSTNEFISKAKEEEILEALNLFEKSKKFTDSDMTISILATELNTNIKYVSYILKNYRNCNYSQYINQNRIDYLIALLIEDPKIRKYKLDYLANLVGFSSNNRLTILFKEYKGISPSDFIHKLNNEK